MTRLPLAVLALPVALIAQEPEDEPATSRSQRAFLSVTFDLSESGYNRVEGLPFLVGPIGRTEGPNPLQGQALLVVRSDPATDLDQVGYRVQIEKLFFGRRRLITGVLFHAEVGTIENRGLSNLDNSLSTLVFHEDYRDYYERTGLSAYATYAPRGRPWQVGVEYRAERGDPVPAGAAATLFNNTDSWRHQPLAATGWIHTLSAGARYDTRPDRVIDFSAGWHLTAEITQGIAGTMSYPLLTNSTGSATVDLPDIDADFLLGELDARRYQPIGNALLRLRVHAGGALSSDVLPGQFQHAPGGRGTLPGLSGLSNDPDVFTTEGALPANERALDCGARVNIVGAPRVGGTTTRHYATYGCDRFVLAQVQFEGYFGFRFGGRNVDVTDPRIGLSFELVPRWVVFFDAAQAWSNGNLGPLPRPDEDAVYDAGGGIAFGDLGVYVAFPLQDQGDRGARFLVRLGGRI